MFVNFFFQIMYINRQNVQSRNNFIFPVFTLFNEDVDRKFNCIQQFPTLLLRHRTAGAQTSNLRTLKLAGKQYTIIVGYVVGRYPEVHRTLICWPARWARLHVFKFNSLDAEINSLTGHRLTCLFSWLIASKRPFTTPQLGHDLFW